MEIKIYVGQYLFPKSSREILAKKIEIEKDSYKVYEMTVLTQDMREQMAEIVDDRDRKRDETFFCYHRGEQEFMWGNNTELIEQMKIWRKQRKEGVLVMKTFNNKTKYIKGKPWYILVVQDEDIYRGVDNIGMDRLGMGFDTPYLVSGLIYVFKHEKNRDATFNYVMGVSSSSAHA